MLLGWEPNSFLEWTGDEDPELRRIAKHAVLAEAHKLHAKQRENNAHLIAQAIVRMLFGEGD